MNMTRVATAVLAVTLVAGIAPVILSAKDHAAKAVPASRARMAQRDSIQQNLVRPTAQNPDKSELETLADLQMARKEYPEAVKTYKTLITMAPGNAVYLNKLGIAYHQQAMLSVAEHFYKKAAQADPRYPDPLNNIGMIYYQHKKFTKAIRTYKKALAIRPDMAVVYSNLGYAYFSAKQYTEAMNSFQHALQIDPTVFDHPSRTGSILQDRSIMGERGMFNFLVAKSYAQMGNAERCAFFLRKARDEGYTSLAAVKTDPAFAAVLNDPGVQEALQSTAGTKN